MPFRKFPLVTQLEALFPKNERLIPLPVSEPPATQPTTLHRCTATMLSPPLPLAAQLEISTPDGAEMPTPEFPLAVQLMTSQSSPTVMPGPVFEEASHPISTHCTPVTIPEANDVAEQFTIRHLPSTLMPLEDALMFPIVVQASSTQKLAPENPIVKSICAVHPLSVHVDPNEKPVAELAFATQSVTVHPSPQEN